MRIAFFHGLESSHISDKTEYLNDNFDYVYSPKMDYMIGNELFIETLEYIKNNNFDLLVGSSMGGWTAYCLSTETGIPTVLFNPAFVTRTLQFCKPSNKLSNHTVVLGEFDDVINPNSTKQIINNEGVGTFNINMEKIGHRTPIEIFSKYMSKYIV